jgi:hypothetical protein
MQNVPSVGAGASSIQPSLEPLVTEGPNTEFNPLSHIHRNSPECWRKKLRLQNEPSVGVGASSIQPTLVFPRYRGPQH